MDETEYKRRLERTEEVIKKSVAVYLPEAEQRFRDMCCRECRSERDGCFPCFFSNMYIESFAELLAGVNSSFN